MGAWNADLYDGKHSFVSSFGNDLVELLAPQKGERILDLGCGTGDLAKRLASFGGSVVGVDQSENMVVKARKKYPQIPFLVGDALDLDYIHEFDAVFSNATLHWIKKPGVVLEGIYRSLKHGGRFVAEFGGQGNVAAITNAIIQQLKNTKLEWKEEDFPWYYPSIGEYSTRMEEAGFRVIFAQHFDRPTPLEGENGLRNWIEMFANSMIDGQGKEMKEQILLKVEQNLKESLWSNGKWIADYKRIRVIGLKE